MNLIIPERIRLLKMDGEKLQSYLKSNSDIDDDMKDKIYEDRIDYERALRDYETWGYDFEFENYHFKHYVMDAIIKIKKEEDVQVTYEEALDMVENSSMNYMMHIDPSFVGHYSPEYWAESILDEEELEKKFKEDKNLNSKEFWEKYKDIYESKILDEKYQQELERAYKDNAETDVKWAEELMEASYEADQIMNGGKIVFDEAREMFGEMRDFTEEEQIKYDKSIEKLFKPTGRNIFDEL